MVSTRSVVRFLPEASALTDVGQVRNHNEDYVLLRLDLRLYVVADGMGGHGSGEVASSLAAKSLENFFEATATDPALVDEVPATYAKLAIPARRLVAAIRKANRDVFEISRTVSKHKGMGSTTVAMHLGDDGKLHIAHVGDSRCYRLREGVLTQLTRDHSLINEALAMKPDLTPAELAQFPKNIVTRGMGMAAEVQVDAQSVEVLPGDDFLLCSDGLTGMVTDADILAIIEVADSVQEACELLVAEANNNGGNDNVSAMLVRFHEAPPEDEELEEEAPELTVEPTPTPDPSGSHTMPGMQAAVAIPLPVEPPMNAAISPTLQAQDEVPDIEFAPTFPNSDRTKCGYCAKELEPYMNFCGFCGARVEVG